MSFWSESDAIAVLCVKSKSPHVASAEKSAFVNAGLSRIVRLSFHVRESARFDAMELEVLFDEEFCSDVLECVDAQLC